MCIQPGWGGGGGALQARRRISGSLIMVFCWDHEDIDFGEHISLLTYFEFIFRRVLHQNNLFLSVAVNICEHTVRKYKLQNVSVIL